MYRYSNLGRPIRREADFHSKPCSPANEGLVFVDAEGFGFEIAVGETASIAYPARPRRVPNQGLENFHGAKVSSAALTWMSVSAPNTNCPVCQLYPSWPPPATPAGSTLLLVTLAHS